MTTLTVASDGSREQDARVQVLEKSGHAEGPRVIQLFVASREQPHLSPGQGCVWLTPQEARELALHLLALSGEDGRKTATEDGGFGR